MPAAAEMQGRPAQYSKTRGGSGAGLLLRANVRGINRGMHSGRKTIPRAGQILPAAPGHEDRSQRRRIGWSERLRLAHLFQRLRGVLHAHRRLPAVAWAPNLKEQYTSGRRIVHTAVDNPVDTQGTGNCNDVGVVSHDDQQPVLRLLQRSGPELSLVA